MDFLVAQIIGVAALVFSAVSFQQNTHKKIMLCQMAAGLLFAIHFFLIGATTGGVTNSIAVVRSILFYNRDRKWAAGVLWPIVFCIAFIISGIVTWQGPLSLLPILAMVINTFTFAATNPTVVRTTILFSSPLWLLYNCISLSFPGIINESFVILSTIIGIVRFDRGKLKKLWQSWQEKA